MRILFLGNNWVGWQVAKWFKEQDHEVVGLVVHPSSTQQYRDGIATALGLPASQVFDGSRLREPATREAINDLNADIGLSVYFGYILRAEFIDMFEKGIVNLHPGYLPYNKGKHTNVWSILDGTPAGVTLHYINVGIDTGDVIAQQEVVVEQVDTGETLYHKLEKAALNLLKDNWVDVCNEQLERIPQDRDSGSYHNSSDLAKSDFIDLDKTYQGGELIDILRARTFPPHVGAFFIKDGRKVHLRLELSYGDPL